MSSPSPAEPSSPNSNVRDTNQSFYDGLWANVRLVEPSRFNTWPKIQTLAANAPQRLEVGPGMRPRLPIKDTCFTDISEPALAQLARRGGHSKVADITRLPYADNSFDLVCALDIVEHVEDDLAALDELCRVARPGAILLLSVPLHPSYWTTFDELVGHYRRYEPEQLTALLQERNLQVLQSSGYGMKPKSSRLVNWSMEHLRKNPKRSLWWYNRVFMPIGLRLQKPMVLSEGLVDTRHIGEVFMICQLNKNA